MSLLLRLTVHNARNRGEEGGHSGITRDLSSPRYLWQRLNSSSSLANHLYFGLLRYTRVQRCNTNKCTFTPSITVTFSSSSIPKDTFRFVLPLPPISTGRLYPHQFAYNNNISLSYRGRRALMTAATTATGAQNTSIKVILALQYHSRSFVGWNNLKPIIAGGVPSFASERVDGTCSSSGIQPANVHRNGSYHTKQYNCCFVKRNAIVHS